MSAQGLRGRLLAATPPLIDENFRHAVVLLLEHGDEGAVGLVLNQPTMVPVEETLPGWSWSAVQPEVVFRGGPVEPQAAIALGRSTVGTPADGWTAVTGPVGVVDLRRSPEEVRVDAVRLFAGYAGWGPGQLDAEIDAGSWFVVDAAPDDAFTADPPGLWLQVVRRQGGLYRTFPSDPSRN